MKINEGLIFSVPTNGSYIIGLTVRSNKAFGLVYFYPTVFTTQPTREDASKVIGSCEPILRCKVGFLGFKDKSWNLIGNLPKWSSEKWPMPLFWRKDPISQAISLDEYDEFTLLSTRKGNENDLNLPSNSLYGHKVVEAKLKKLLQ